VTAPDLALAGIDEEILIEQVTHVINCAASVNFDRPLEEAAASNITGALNMLSFAKRCSALRSMAHVSTAYVWPHRLSAEPCDESLVPLPFNRTWCMPTSPEVARIAMTPMHVANITH
jgi:dTDP-4-dehydrorhamnose reductase